MHLDSGAGRIGPRSITEGGASCAQSLATLPGIADFLYGAADAGDRRRAQAPLGEVGLAEAFRREMV